jgi:hypothetical protein
MCSHGVDCVAFASRGSAASSLEGGSAPTPVADSDPCVCHGVVVGGAGLVNVIVGYDIGCCTELVERKGKQRDKERQNQFLHRRGRGYMYKQGSV